MDIVNSVALLELIAPITSAALPVLLTVKVRGDEDEPTLTLPKPKGDPGNTPILAAVPVPFRVTKKLGVL